MTATGFSVDYDQELNAAVMEWAGYFTVDQFKEGTEKMLNCMKQHQSKKVLALIRDMMLIGAEEQKWLEVSFLPRAIEQGFKACALLTPFYHFSKVAVENITWKIDKKKLIVNLFDNEQEARNWLKSVEV